jgi:hypothetical protein
MEPAPVRLRCPDRANDKEVVVMSKTLEPAHPWAWARRVLLALLVLPLYLVGCASVSQDVDAYYRQMAYNYKEAQQKAKMEALTLESETKVLASTGEFGKYRRAQRELNRVKSWEARCEKEANRFKKAAEWTEAHLHVERPPIPDAPPGYGSDADEAVVQTSGTKDTEKP